MADAVGIGLAIVPLMISAAEHFNQLRHAVARFRNFPDEAQRLLSILNVQRTIFRSEVRLLLAPFTGHQLAQEMLENLDHPEWTADTFLKAMESRFGARMEAIAQAIFLITGKLAYLESKTQKYIDSHEKEKKNISFGDKDWRKNTSHRLKLAILEPEFAENLDLLRGAIQDFRTLRAQTEEFHQRRLSKLAAVVTEQEVEKFATMQKTSKMLYEALSVACTKHIEHNTRFSLRPIFNSNTGQVRFNLAIRRPPSMAIASSQDLIWLTVESSFVAPSAVSHTHSDIRSTTNQVQLSLKRKAAPSVESSTSSPCKPKTVPKKRVHFCTPSPSSPPNPPPTPSNLLNICKHNNLCNHLQTVICQSINSHHCIGYLEQGPGAKYLVYIDGKASVRNGCLTKSLLDLFQGHKKGLSFGYQSSQYQRTCVASSLATAVLQFHPTPWLSNSLNSKELYFDSSCRSTLANIDGLREPFVDVSVKKPDNMPYEDSSRSLRHFAPNLFLFRLGVMLLELAFEEPIKRMEKPIDRQGKLEDQHAEFFTARRMTRVVSSTMGVRYAEVVRKCLHCDFGRGDDLASPALQEAFYREVVCELGQLEDGFRKLHIAD